MVNLKSKVILEIEKMKHSLKCVEVLLQLCQNKEALMPPNRWGDQLDIPGILILSYLIQAGLAQKTDVKNRAFPVFEATQKGRAWAVMICATPLPQHVCEYVDPRSGEKVTIE